MAASTMNKFLGCYNIFRTSSLSFSIIQRCNNPSKLQIRYCSQQDSTEGVIRDISDETKGFIHAQAKLDKIAASANNTSEHDEQSGQNKSKCEKSFAEMYYESAMVQIGDISQQKVIGKVIQKVNDDLYIDYGGKFHCVCKAPRKEESERYKVGKEVVVRVISHEMSSRFMGFDKDMTLLEANAKLSRNQPSDNNQQELKAN